MFFSLVSPIAVTAVINIVEGGRKSLFIRSTLPPLISDTLDTLVTGLVSPASPPWWQAPHMKRSRRKELLDNSEIGIFSLSQCHS